MRLTYTLTLFTADTEQVKSLIMFMPLLMENA